MRVDASTKFFRESEGGLKATVCDGLQRRVEGWETVGYGGRYGRGTDCESEGGESQAKGKA